MLQKAIEKFIVQHILFSAIVLVLFIGAAADAISWTVAVFAAVLLIISVMGDLFSIGAEVVWENVKPDDKAKYKPKRDFDRLANVQDEVSDYFDEDTLWGEGSVK